MQSVNPCCGIPLLDLDKFRLINNLGLRFKIYVVPFGFAKSIQKILQNYESGTCSSCRHIGAGGRPTPTTNDDRPTILEAVMRDIRSPNSLIMAEPCVIYANADFYSIEGTGIDYYRLGSVIEGYCRYLIFVNPRYLDIERTGAKLRDYLLTAWTTFNFAPQANEYAPVSFWRLCNALQPVLIDLVIKFIFPINYNNVPVYHSMIPEIFDQGNYSKPSRLSVIFNAVSGHQPIVPYVREKTIAFNWCKKRTKLTWTPVWNIARSVYDNHTIEVSKPLSNYRNDGLAILYNPIQQYVLKDVEWVTMDMSCPPYTPHLLSLVMPLLKLPAPDKIHALFIKFGDLCTSLAEVYAEMRFRGHVKRDIMITYDEFCRIVLSFLWERMPWQVAFHGVIVSMAKDEKPCFVIQTRSARLCLPDSVLGVPIIDLLSYVLHVRIENGNYFFPLIVDTDERIVKDMPMFAPSKPLLVFNSELPFHGMNQDHESFLFAKALDYWMEYMEAFNSLFSANSVWYSVNKSTFWILSNHEEPEYTVGFFESDDYRYDRIFFRVYYLAQYPRDTAEYLCHTLDYSDYGTVTPDCDVTVDDRLNYIFSKYEKRESIFSDARRAQLFSNLHL